MTLHLIMRIKKRLDLRNRHIWHEGIKAVNVVKSFALRLPERSEETSQGFN